MPRATWAAIHLAARQSDEAKSALSEAYKIRPGLSEYEIGAIVGTRALKALQRLDFPAP